MVLYEAGKTSDAQKTVREFHEKLCHVRVLDPACGSGNSLCVALELMKRLEGEVAKAMADFGDRQKIFTTIDYHQFMGIEVNPRAAAIADDAGGGKIARHRPATNEQGTKNEKDRHEHHSHNRNPARATVAAQTPGCRATARQSETSRDSRCERPNRKACLPRNIFAALESSGIACESDGRVRPGIGMHLRD
ncbi:MAG TPA: hypothetical protein PLR25_14290 [Planctomycetaceae bacterium]|nr:hypothetical protein [Planctomycetaceae bacterium]